MALAKQPDVVSLDPKSIGDVLEDMRRVARATGTDTIAASLVAGLQARLEAVMAKTASVTGKPRVLHLEWADPPICGGHWVPEMVEMAGGINCFGDKQHGSFRLAWADMVASQPEVIILMPCGFDVHRALQDIPILVEQEGWDRLPAVQNHRVYIIDAGAYTSRSGPRLVTGLEIMAEMLHPQLYSGMFPEAAALRLTDDAVKTSVKTSGRPPRAPRRQV